MSQVDSCDPVFDQEHDDDDSSAVRPATTSLYSGKQLPTVPNCPTIQTPVFSRTDVSF